VSEDNRVITTTSFSSQQQLSNCGLKNFPRSDARADAPLLATGSSLGFIVNHRRRLLRRHRNHRCRRCRMRGNDRCPHRNRHRPNGGLTGWDETKSVFRSNANKSTVRRLWPQSKLLTIAALACLLGRLHVGRPLVRPHLPIAATMAVEIAGPMPGTVIGF
jgi:hypothetical protein